MRISPRVKMYLWRTAIAFRHAGDADDDFRIVLHIGVRGRAGGELCDGNQRREGQE